MGVREGVVVGESREPSGEGVAPSGLLGDDRGEGEGGREREAEAVVATEGVAPKAAAGDRVGESDAGKEG